MCDRFIPDRKRLWYKLFNSDLFNRTRTLLPVEFKRQVDKLSGVWCVRYTKKSGQKFTCSKNLAALMKMVEHIPDDQYQLAEQAPDDAIVIQGNYNRLHIDVTFDKKPMGTLLRAKKFKPWKRISKLTLQQYIGYENIRLFDDYLEMYEQDNTSNDIKYSPVIEFSYYNRPVGTLKKRLIVWEIRCGY